MANCVNCGAPVSGDARGMLICGHCGTPQEPPATIEYLELEAETTTRCPVCSSLLRRARLEGYPLLYCAQCSGMLLGMDRFSEMVAAARFRERRSTPVVLPRRQTVDQRRLTCPECGRPMRAHIYAGPGNVVIDTCERCELNWLDGGELRRIAAAPDTVRRRFEEPQPDGAGDPTDDDE
jgi:Zn-finger nucleic acid-binding protein